MAVSALTQAVTDAAIEALKAGVDAELVAAILRQIADQVEAD
jgi:hypothetical protein